MDKPGAGKPAQGNQVDMGFFKRVVTGNVPRQHTGIRRLQVPTYQRYAHPGHRLHGKLFQHRDMGMSTTDQHQVFQNRDVIHPHAPDSTGLLSVIYGHTGHKPDKLQHCNQVYRNLDMTSLPV